MTKYLLHRHTEAEEKAMSELPQDCEEGSPVLTCIVVIIPAGSHYQSAS